MTPTKLIQVQPERVTRRGRLRGPQYLFRINYPGLLSGNAVTITTTGEPSSALAYAAEDPEVIESVLVLLDRLGYEGVEVVELDDAAAGARS